MGDTTLNKDLDEEIKKIRDKTFTPEFKKLVSKVLNDKKESSDLLKNLHELYYRALSRFYNGFQNLDLLVSDDNDTTDEIDRIYDNFVKNGFSEIICFQYNFEENIYLQIKNSFNDSMFANFFIDCNDSIFSEIIDSDNGKLYSTEIFYDDFDYKKRLLLEEQSVTYKFIAFSPYRMIKKAIENLNDFNIFKNFCPIFFIKIDENEPEDSISIQKLMPVFQINLLLYILLVQKLMIKLHNNIYIANSYYDVFKLFELFYEISKHNFDNPELIVIKSDNERSDVYCLFKYIYEKLSQKQHMYKYLIFRPLIGIIAIFKNALNVDMLDEIKINFNDEINIYKYDMEKSKNAFNLFIDVVG